jgi:hypothetical protein
MGDRGWRSDRHGPDSADWISGKRRRDWPRLEGLRSDIKRLENSFRSDPEMHTSLCQAVGRTRYYPASPVRRYSLGLGSLVHL